jgi:hypothetical protein
VLRQSFGIGSPAFQERLGDLFLLGWREWFECHAHPKRSGHLGESADGWIGMVRCEEASDASRLSADGACQLRLRELSGLSRLVKRINQLVDRGDSDRLPDVLSEELGVLKILGEVVPELAWCTRRHRADRNKYDTPCLGAGRLRADKWALTWDKALLKRSGELMFAARLLCDLYLRISGPSRANGRYEQAQAQGLPLLKKWHAGGESYG